MMTRLDLMSALVLAAFLAGCSATETGFSCIDPTECLCEASGPGSVVLAEAMAMADGSAATVHVQVVEVVEPESGVTVTPGDVLELRIAGILQAGELLLIRYTASGEVAFLRVSDDSTRVYCSYDEEQMYRHVSLTDALSLMRDEDCPSTVRGLEVDGTTPVCDDTP